MVTSPHPPSPEPAPPEAWTLPRPQSLLSPASLKPLTQKSDRHGYQQLAAHLLILASSGALWGWSWNQIAGNLTSLNPSHLGIASIALTSLLIYGFSLAALFAPVHEGVHRTVFTHPRANDLLAWWAGVLSLYNSSFYQRYHLWHHRYTRVAGGPDQPSDPELEDPEPHTWSQYLLQLSGIPWWLGKIQGHWRIATGRMEHCPYIPAAARDEVQQSTQRQIAIYALGVALSIAVGQPWILTYWLIPLALGQPILRFILLAEHTGCSFDDNPLTNTRTTHTLWPLRLLMWNMPFHAEHHLYPSIPFHALPQAHAQLQTHFTHVDSGYLTVNRAILSELGKANRG